MLLIQNFLLGFKYVILSEALANICRWSEVLISAFPCDCIVQKFSGIWRNYRSHLGSTKRGTSLAVLVAGFPTKGNIALTKDSRFIHTLVLASSRIEVAKRFFRTSVIICIEVLVLHLIILWELWKGRLVESAVVWVTHSFALSSPSGSALSTMDVWRLDPLQILFLLLFPDCLEITQGHWCTFKNSVISISVICVISRSHIKCSSFRNQVIAPL